jgi:sodium-dependent dicarboxylate transporter 2/3/5
MPGLALLVVMAGFSVFISNFMSNTAASNLMIPIAVSMGVFSPILGAVAIALACSMAMSLPISTPPNAIAFATQVIETRDMARYGTIVSMIGIVVMLAVLYIAFGMFHIM